MSSISSISQSFQISAAHSARSGSPARRLEQDLSKYLSAQGVSTDDQSTIQDEIKQAIASATTEGSRPEPATIRSAVKSVLDKHGLNGDDFVSKLPAPSSRPVAGGRAQGAAGRPSGPPPGGRPAGPPPGPPPVDNDDDDDSSVNSTSSTDSTSSESFLKKLLTLLAEIASNSDTSSISNSSSQTSATINRSASNKLGQTQLPPLTSLDYLA